MMYEHHDGLMYITMCTNIEHMGSGDRVRNDQKGSKLASKRIRETEALYKAKRIIDGLSSTRKELEKDIANTERPHPAKQCP
ncbi:hypothetical protein EVAR_57862_1 [Eumeta japonica]|uniref:Uncharacterized protein n=1 Tax=Eumeta variegata TaxID=151549 RepID=A0A4C1ZEE7_EUMVA|nr:hypothetical protein EVAR_57862_1 [Eumeta japonica]